MNPDIRYSADEEYIPQLAAECAQVKLSISDIKGENDEYGPGVILDTTIFDGVKPRNWGKVLERFVYNNLAGTQMTMYDTDGTDESCMRSATSKKKTEALPAATCPQPFPEGLAQHHTVLLLKTI